MALKSPLMNVMQQAARKAGRELLRDFADIERQRTERLQIIQKRPGDFVTASDIKIDEMLRELLSKARPEFGFLTEEGKATGDANGRRWIIDPIDGTANFVHGIPHFSISIALQDQGRITAGLVYNPVNDEMFSAERGNGAYLNDTRLRVSMQNHLDHSVIGTGVPHLGRQGYETFVRELDMIAPKVAGIRRMGSAALDLAWVACGRLDAYWERKLSSWDIAAGVLLVREAGGYVTTPEGGEKVLDSGDLLAANPDLHAALRRMFRDKFAKGSE